VAVHEQRAGSASLSARLGFDGLTAELSVGYESEDKVRRLVVVGTDGAAVFDDTLTERKLRLFDVTGEAARRLIHSEHQLPALFPKLAPRLPALEPLRIEAAHFVEAVLAGVPFRTDATEGARVVEILEAGQESLETGGLVVSVAPRAQRASLTTKEREDDALVRTPIDPELLSVNG
jgi:predicted dehydrogenase